MESLTVVARHPIEPYRGSFEKLRQIAVRFTGSPRSSQSPGKLLLLNDPGSQHAFFYEFRVEDILFAEEAPSLALPDGSTASVVRLWVRKGATALKIESFHVQDTAAALHDFFGR
ncbi:MAG TPA: inorganic pyrophosphatase Ppa [bacterium]|nr:inorganic pyrophosphatase Ppa [bacterium]